MHRCTLNRSFVVALVATGTVGSNALGADSWADSVISYTPGSGANPSYNNPATSLGEPTRYTGVGTFPSAVTPFNPAFLASELVSIGNGGSLVVSFNEPVTNDPLNPFGIDLLVFGNSFFEDTNFPTGTAGSLFGGTGSIEVSPDGIAWTLVPSKPADGLFPTIGYGDLTDPYSLVPGAVPSDFTKPVDPSMDLTGLNYTQILAAYDGSGGGAGVDLGSLGLSQISFVRITGQAGGSVEIDGFSDVAAVPAPGVAIVAIALAPLAARRRRVEGGRP